MSTLLPDRRETERLCAALLGHVLDPMRAARAVAGEGYLTYPRQWY
jgi:hypothetical protein